MVLYRDTWLRNDIVTGGEAGGGGEESHGLNIYNKIEFSEKAYS